MTNVYYADLFIINGQGCLVMGFGKSLTCRKYTGELTKEISSDFVCFEKCDNSLIGYSGYGMLAHRPVDPETDQHTVIKYILRMLDETETEQLGIKEVTSVDLDTIVEMCEFNVNFAQDCDRTNEFKKLISNTDISFLLIPWCNSMETKGNKISRFVK